MEAFNSKDLAMKAQKKILSSMANKSTVQRFIDDTTSEILDELYRVSKEYTGNKGVAQKVIKNLIKIAVKIGVLFRNNCFSEEELKLAQEFKKKLHTGAMTAISFYEVNLQILTKQYANYMQPLEIQLIEITILFLTDYKKGLIHTKYVGKKHTSSIHFLLDVMVKSIINKTQTCFIHKLL